MELQLIDFEPMYDPESRAKKPRIYVWVKNETVPENLLHRRSRPTKIFRAIVEQVLPFVGLEGRKLIWSQKAGCSCGCSPGFIVQGPISDFHDLHITVLEKE